MRVVHGLEGDAGVIAVEVAVLNEVLDGIDDLEIVSVLIDAWTQWCSYPLQEVCLFKSGLQHCEQLE